MAGTGKTKKFDPLTADTNQLKEHAVKLQAIIANEALWNQLSTVGDVQALRMLSSNVEKFPVLVEIEKELAEELQTLVKRRLNKVRESKQDLRLVQRLISEEQRPQS